MFSKLNLKKSGAGNRRPDALVRRSMPENVDKFGNATNTGLADWDRMIGLASDPGMKNQARGCQHTSHAAGLITNWLCRLPPGDVVLLVCLGYQYNILEPALACGVMKNICRFALGCSGARDLHGIFSVCEGMGCGFPLSMRDVEEAVVGGATIVGDASPALRERLVSQFQEVVNSCDDAWNGRPRANTRSMPPPGPMMGQEALMGPMPSQQALGAPFGAQTRPNTPVSLPQSPGCSSSYAIGPRLKTKQGCVDCAKITKIPDPVPNPHDLPEYGPHEKGGWGSEPDE
jgi:hypothetical protein